MTGIYEMHALPEIQTDSNSALTAVAALDSEMITETEAETKIKTEIKTEATAEVQPEPEADRKTASLPGTIARPVPPAAQIVQIDSLAAEMPPIEHTVLEQFPNRRADSGAPGEVVQVFAHRRTAVLDSCCCVAPMELAQAYVCPQRLEGIFAPVEGLQMGTLFPNLSRPYQGRIR